MEEDKNLVRTAAEEEGAQAAQAPLVDDVRRPDSVSVEAAPIYGTESQAVETDPASESPEGKAPSEDAEPAAALSTQEDEAESPETGSVIVPTENADMQIDNDGTQAIADQTVPSVNEEAIPQETPTTTTEEPAAASIPQKAVGHKTPIGAVVAAIIIGLLLVAIAVLAYLKTQDNGSGSATLSKNESSQNPAQTKVTGSDVSQASQEIDSTLDSVDNTTDFNTESLSDTSLGL